ncbi:crystallin J1A [Eurytemora carolleeae]|uniref:crystallin J1A n=1 Tax=Eurytemora carolleeae TaxID=1294199 RepID=UPI000C79162E|nr:crystallin J1A [Eurytemora carolleeae]|eukprot:XP_023325893.1 crystallin J1A-like [Eurytemora affinis]
MSKLLGLIDSVNGLPDPAKKRSNTHKIPWVSPEKLYCMIISRVSAVLGSIVADAASLPLEWIYKDSTMKEIVGDNNPEFWKECKCPFFTVPMGHKSCYGDEMANSLKTLAGNDGQVDLKKISSALKAFYGSPDSPYQAALARRADKKYPVEGPWINGGVIQFLKNSSAGQVPPGSAECEDNDGFALSLPVFLKDSTQIKEVAELLTTNPMVLQHLAVQTRILKHYLEGTEDPVRVSQSELKDKFPEVCQEIQEVADAVNAKSSLGDIVEQFGKACGLPGSFQGSIAALLIHNDYVG